MSFTNIYSKNITGLVTFTGNTLGLDGNCSSFPNYSVGCTGPGTSSFSGAWITTDTLSYASNTWRTFVQGLPQTSTIGGTTFNYTQAKSSGVLNIPSGVTIDYAVLIWSAGWGINTSVDALTTPCNLTTPLGNTISISPTYGLTSVTLSASGDKCYTCAADITSIVESADSGVYTVGNIYTEFTSNTSSAGWSILVVYEDPAIAFHNISINLGDVYVDSDSPDYGVLTSFKTPESPYPIIAKAVITALHGDSNVPGDTLSLSNASSVFTELSGPYNPSGNFFGSQIQNTLGQIDTLGTFGSLNARVGLIETRPGLRNGFDLAYIDIAPALSNDQTSATLASETTGNTYYLTSFTSIIEEATARIDISSFASRSSMTLAETFIVSYTISNIGNKATETIDFSFGSDSGLSFISGSYTDPSDPLVTYNITQTPNALTLPNVGISQTMVITLTYQSNTIPDALVYENLGAIHYTTSAGSTPLDSTIYSASPIDITFTDTISANDHGPSTTTVPLVNPGAPNLVYSVSTPPTQGTVNVSSQGVITYTLVSLTSSSDIFVILVTNTDTGETLGLTYNVDITVSPDLSVTYTATPSPVTLSNSATFIYTLTNDNSIIPITDLTINPYPSSGLMFSSANYTAGGITSDLPHVLNDYYVGSIGTTETVIARMVYTALEIPTDLFYQNSSDITYLFGGSPFSTSVTSPVVNIVGIVNVSMFNTEVYTQPLPITEPGYMDLSYSLITQGSLGTASVNPSGIITFTPLSGVVGLDTVVIRATNSQNSNTLDITYYFDIKQQQEPPVNVTLADELLFFLENDLFLGAINNSSIPANVCFDCALWNNGYTYSGTLVIPPIKTTFNSLLSSVIAEIQNYINTNICNDYGLTAQLDRFLGIVRDLQNNINTLPCDGNCFNDRLIAHLLSLSIRTLNSLITIVSNIEGLARLCSMNCPTCSSAFDLIVSSLINDITVLACIMPNWNSLVLAFMGSNAPTPKTYVAGYMPKQPVPMPPPPPNNMSFYCGPSNCGPNNCGPNSCR